MAGAPEDGSGAPIAIIAGGGQVPVHLARSMADRGLAFVVVMLKGDADPALAAYDHIAVNPVELARFKHFMLDRGVRTVTLVGSVRGRPDIGRFRPDWTTLRFIGRIVGALGRGDDALLRAVVGMMEDGGLKVVGAHELEPDLVAPAGLLGSVAVPKGQRASIDTGVAAATTLGALDAGQAVVVVGRRVVALEGAEGTDAMIERVAQLRAIGRLGRKKGGVLVKLRKPGQDIRVDMPTIGPQTVRHAAAAGLAGIAVHGENTLVMDRAATVEAADRAGLFLVGLTPDPVALTSGEGPDDG